MSLIEPGDLNQHLRSARSWLKETSPKELEVPTVVKLDLEPPQALPEKAADLKPQEAASHDLPKVIPQQQAEKASPSSGQKRESGCRPIRPDDRRHDPE